MRRKTFQIDGAKRNWKENLHCRIYGAEFNMKCSLHLYMKYIVTEYKSKDLRVLYIFSFWSLIQNFIYSHVRDCILSSIKYDLVQRCIKILQGS